MAIIQSGSTSDLLTIDPTSKSARASLYNTDGTSMVITDGQNVVGSQIGIPIAGASDNTYRVLRTDRIGSIRTGNDTLLLHDDIEGATINTQLWTSVVGTFTTAQVATTGINLNSGNGLAAGSYSILTSQKQFGKMQSAPIRARIRARIVPQTNAIIEMGFCAPVTTTAQIATGAFFRLTATGSLTPVIAYNNADTVVGNDMWTSLVAVGGANNYYTFGIWVDDDNVLFTIQDVSTGKTLAEQSLQIPLTQPKTFSATHLPFATRLWIPAGSAAPSAPYVYFSDIMVLMLDVLMNKMWQHQLAGTANGGEILPTTFLQSSNWTNSTVATNATLSNTAAGYTTLGGLFSFAAVAGAVTDYALFGFTVPAPYTFYCTGVHITTYNTGAAVATSATLLHWGVANNSSAVSLATAGLNRVPVGAQSFPIASAIGAIATDVDLKFDAPLVTNGGRIMHVILRMPVGTATASQVVQGSVT
jgi:hypothetical protein